MLISIREDPRNPRHQFHIAFGSGSSKFGKIND
jgi:hypothetical protein